MEIHVQLSAIGELADKVEGLQNINDLTIQHVEELRADAYELMPEGSIPATEGFFTDAISGLKHIAEVVYKFIRDTINNILGIKSDDFPPPDIIGSKLAANDKKVKDKLKKTLKKETNKAKKKQVDVKVPFISLYPNSKNSKDIVFGINEFLTTHYNYGEYLLNCLQKLNSAIAYSQSDLYYKYKKIDKVINSLGDTKLGTIQTIFGIHEFVIPKGSSFSTIKLSTGARSQFVTYNVDYKNTDRSLFPLVKDFKRQHNSFMEEYTKLSVSLARMASDELTQKHKPNSYERIHSVLLQVTAFYKYIGVYSKVSNYLDEIPNMIYTRSMNRNKPSNTTSIDLFVNALGVLNNGDYSSNIGNEQIMDTMNEFNTIALLIDDLNKETLTYQEVCAVEELAVSKLPDYEAVEVSGVEGIIHNITGNMQLAKHHLMRVVKKLVAWLMGRLGIDSGKIYFDKLAESDDFYLKMRKLTLSSYDKTARINKKLITQIRKKIDPNELNSVSFDEESLLDIPTTIKHSRETLMKFLTAILAVYDEVGNSQVIKNPVFDKSLGDRVNAVIEDAYDKHITAAMHQSQPTVFGRINITRVNNGIPIIVRSGSSKRVYKDVKTFDYRDDIITANKKVKKVLSKDKKSAPKRLADIMVVLTYFKNELEANDNLSPHYLSAYYSLAQIVAMYPKIIQALHLAPFVGTLINKGHDSYYQDLMLKNVMASRFVYTVNGVEGFEDQDLTIEQLLDTTVERCEVIDSLWGESKITDPIEVKYRSFKGKDMLGSTSYYSGNLDVFNLGISSKLEPILDSLDKLLDVNADPSEVYSESGNLIKSLNNTKFKVKHAEGDLRCTKLFKNTNVKVTSSDLTTHYCTSVDAYKISYPSTSILRDSIIPQLDKLYSKTSTLDAMGVSGLDERYLKRRKELLTSLRFAILNLNELYKVVIVNGFKSPFVNCLPEQPAVEDLEEELSEEVLSTEKERTYYKEFALKDKVARNTMSLKEQLAVRTNPRRFAFGKDSDRLENKILSEVANTYIENADNVCNILNHFVHEQTECIKDYTTAIVKNPANASDYSALLWSKSKELRKSLPPNATKLYKLELSFIRNGSLEDHILEFTENDEEYLHSNIPDSEIDKFVRANEAGVDRLVTLFAKLSSLEDKTLYLKNIYFKRSEFNNASNIVETIIDDLTSLTIALDAMLADLKRYINDIIVATITMPSVVHRLAKR